MIEFIKWLKLKPYLLNLNQPKARQSKLLKKKKRENTFKQYKCINLRFSGIQDKCAERDLRSVSRLHFSECKKISSCVWTRAPGCRGPRQGAFPDLQLYECDCWRKHSFESTFSVFYEAPFDVGICLIDQYFFYFLNLAKENFCLVSQNIAFCQTESAQSPHIFPPGRKIGKRIPCVVFRSCKHSGV